MPLVHPTPKPRGLGTRVIRAIAPLVKGSYTHGAIVLVRNAADEVLMVRESYRERGRWGLPGGFLNLREEPAHGAARELREEVGIKCAVDELRPLLVYKQPWARHFDHAFGLTATDEVIPARNHEIREQGWFALSRVRDELQLTAAANELILRLTAANLLPPSNHA